MYKYLPRLKKSSSRVVIAAWELKQAIDSGHLASIADLAWLLLHGREGLPENKDAAFKMAEEGSRQGCPHSQGVLALCVFRSEESCAANKGTARQHANASAEAGSKHVQFALGRILECETPNSAPSNAQGYALAAAQGPDEAQVDWGMAIEFESVESGGGKHEARRLLLLAAAQGSHTACEQLLDLPLDDGEENYWHERIHSARNASLYSAGLPRRSATLTNSVSVQAGLDAISQLLLNPSPPLVDFRTRARTPA
jgi:TPR repeat protein